MEKEKTNINQRLVNALLVHSGVTNCKGLLNGKAGYSVFFYYLAHQTNNQVYEDYAGELLEQVTGELLHTMSVGFSSGLSGIAWSLRHLLLNGFIEAGEDDILRDLDTHIYQTDRKKPKLEKDYNDFDGHLLYYLSCPWQNEDIFRLLWSDLKQQLQSTGNQAYPCPDYVLSQLYFIRSVQSQSKYPSDMKEVIGLIPDYLSRNMKPWNPIEKSYLDCLLKELGLTNFSSKDKCLAPPDPEMQIEWQSQLAIYRLIFPGLYLDTDTYLDTNMEPDSSLLWNLVISNGKKVRYGFVKYGWMSLSGEELKTSVPIPKQHPIYIFNRKSRASAYGIGTYIQELTRYLQNTLLQVTVIHLDSEKQEFTIEQGRITSWYIPAPTSLGYADIARENYLNMVVCFLRLNTSTLERPVFHLNYTNDYFLLLKLKEIFKCRIILVVHYMEWTLLINGGLVKMKAILKQTEDELTDPLEKNALQSFQKEQKFFNEADRIIGLANYAFDILHQEYGVPAYKINIINNGLSDKFSSIPIDKNKLRDQYLIDSQEKILLYAGRLDEIKGVIWLVKAFREVLKEEPETRLWIVGDGAYNSLLKEASGIWNKIFFTGQIPREQLFELYLLADVGVIPSVFEPFGYVAVEMMMAGLPVVSTSAGGLDEIVVDGVTGCKVPITENNTEILTKQLVWLLRHPEERRQMGNNGRRRYREKYTVDIMGERMLECYRSLIEMSQFEGMNLTMQQ